MARISKQTRLQKQTELNDLVLELFWEQGAGAVTYSEVANRYGTSKSAIQRYYPSQQHFIDYLKRATVPFIENRIDRTNQENVINSWFEALNDTEDRYFRKSVEFLFRESLATQPTESLSKEFEEFRVRFKAEFDSDLTFFYVVGRTYATLTGAYARYDDGSVK